MGVLPCYIAAFLHVFHQKLRMMRIGEAACLQWVLACLGDGVFAGQGSAWGEALEAK